MNFRAYYQLTKPGIIYGNAITFAAGFFLAAKGHPNWGHFFWGLLGLSLVIASGCVINNYIDRDIDRQMQRTKNRALVTGKISHRAALIYAVFLGLAGIFALGFGANFLILGIVLAGAFIYVVLYGIWKRRSQHGTIIGSFAGAVPPVAGYAAAANRLDVGALIIFLILVFWQMPHFYAIAIYRLDEYTQANIPVLPAKKGIRRTKIEILLYTIGFAAVLAVLYFFKYAGKVYLSISELLALFWIIYAIKGFSSKIAATAWARRMFLLSLLIITVLSIAIGLGSVLP